MIARQTKKPGAIRSHGRFPSRIGQMLALVGLTVSSVGLCGCDIIFADLIALEAECPPSLSVEECCEFLNLRSVAEIEADPNSSTEEEISCDEFEFFFPILAFFGLLEDIPNDDVTQNPPNNQMTGDGSQGQDNPNEDDPNDDPNDGGTVEELASKNVVPRSGTMIDQDCNVLSSQFLIGSVDIMLEESDIGCTIRVTVTAKGNANGRPNVLFKVDGGDPVKVEGEGQDSNTTVLEFTVDQAGAAFAAFSESASLADSYDIKVEKICP